MMKTTVLLLVTCLAVTLSAAYAAKIKIHLEKESVEKYKRHISRRQSSESACTDVEDVDRSTLTLPGRLSTMLNERVTFYRSDIVTSNLEFFENTTVVPLVGDFPTTYLREVLNVLRDSDCIPFIYGGTIRDQFLAVAVADADVQVDCDLEAFGELCVNNWGEENCELELNRPRPEGHIGVQTPEQPDVDLVSTEISLYADVSRLEFTVNSMAYDLNGNNVILDLTGNGVMDVCTDPRRIRISADDDTIEEWQQWATDTAGTAFLRFWKLRVKDFEAYNQATMDFIINGSISRIESIPGEFGRFYCDEVYDTDFDAESNTCEASAEHCSNTASLADAYNEIFAEDFGTYWTETIEPNLPACGSGAVKIAFQTTLLCVLLFMAVFI